MTTQVATKKSVKDILAAPNVKSRFEEVLGKKAPLFISSIITSVSLSKHLQDCDPVSVVSAASVAAALDLPINSSLGFAHIVPYSGKAQFQLGWKGFLQLAQRTGLYKTINAAIVYDGQIVSRDPFTGEMVLDASKKKSDAIAGYVCYFKLMNGFEKYFFMSHSEVTAHGKKYSKSFSQAGTPWQINFDSMALKTVVKLGIGKYGPMSVDIQRAVEVDGAVIKEDGTPDYIDVDGTEDPPAAEAPKRASEKAAQ